MAETAQRDYEETIVPRLLQTLRTFRGVHEKTALQRQQRAATEAQYPLNSRSKNELLGNRLKVVSTAMRSTPVLV